MLTKLAVFCRCFLAVHTAAQAPWLVAAQMLVFLSHARREAGNQKHFVSVVSFAPFWSAMLEGGASGVRMHERLRVPAVLSGSVERRYLSSRTRGCFSAFSMTQASLLPHLILANSLAHLGTKPVPLFCLDKAEERTPSLVYY
jgi:hypothetical protein